MLADVGHEHALGTAEVVASRDTAPEPRLPETLTHVVVEADVDSMRRLIQLGGDDLIQGQELVDRALAAAARLDDDEAAVDVRTARTGRRILNRHGGVVEELLMLVAREPEPRHPVVRQA